MPHVFTRPAGQHLHVEREPVEATCPECGSTDVRAYRVLSDGGWWDVRKCQSCLYSIERDAGPIFGRFEPLRPPGL